MLLLRSGYVLWLLKDCKFFADLVPFKMTTFFYFPGWYFYYFHCVLLCNDTNLLCYQDFFGGIIKFMRMGWTMCIVHWQCDLSIFFFFFEGDVICQINCTLKINYIHCTYILGALPKYFPNITGQWLLYSHRRS